MFDDLDDVDCVHLCLQLDLWYVILNGAVEISHPEGRVETLCMGNSFGISPSLDKQYMNGEVRTKGDDCQVKQTKALKICFSCLLKQKVDVHLQPRCDY